MINGKQSHAFIYPLYIDISIRKKPLTAISLACKGLLLLLLTMGLLNRI